MSQVEQSQKDTPTPKVGRTLLVKPENSNFSTNLFDKLDGLSDKFSSEKSNSHFLTFNNVKNAEKAFDSLNSNENCKVKYALYRLFFKLPGVSLHSDDVDYDNVKKVHSDLVKEKCDGRVLYYKLYRKQNKFLGCGELTVDTLKSFNMLINTEGDGFKEFNLSKLGNDYSVTHFRYNRNDNTKRNNMLNA
jgi:hypothetical protein